LMVGDKCTYQGSSNDKKSFTGATVTCECR
jgi:hypothetical protein